MESNPVTPQKVTQAQKGERSNFKIFLIILFSIVGTSGLFVGGWFLLRSNNYDKDNVDRDSKDILVIDDEKQNEIEKLFSESKIKYESLSKTCFSAQEWFNVNISHNKNISDEKFYSIADYMDKIERCYTKGNRLIYGIEYYFYNLNDEVSKKNEIKPMLNELIECDKSANKYFFEMKSRY